MNFFKFFLIFIFISTLGCSNQNKKNQEFPDKLKILNLLYENNYDQLEIILNNFQNEFESGNLDESLVIHAYNSFKNSDPNIKPIINNWLVKYPDSYSAHISKAKYFYRIGSYSRGIKYYNETTKSQRNKMKEYLDISSNHYKKALKINPKLTVAYQGLIQNKNLYGNNDEIKMYKDKGLSINPTSYSIRSSYLWTLQPKWGGSSKQVINFVNENKKLYELNPELKKLESLELFIEFTNKDSFNTFKGLNEREQDKKYITLLDNTPYERFSLRERAYVYIQLNQTKNAFNDYTKALSLDPQSPDLLSYRAWIFLNNKEYTKALEDLNYAISLDKLNSYALEKRGEVNYYLNKYDLAIDDFKNALIYSSNKEHIYQFMGYINLYNFKNYKEAKLNYIKAYSLNPNNPEINYNLLIAQWNDKDCEFTKTSKLFESLCAKIGNCNKEQLEWAIQARVSSYIEGVCTKQ